MNIEPTHERTDVEILERIRQLPPAIGVTLVAAGVVGMILPGPSGAPLLFAGGFVLAPELFDKVDAYAKTKAPTLRQAGLQLLDRFLSDLERRYPSQERK